jgi:hypothetical protein
MMRAALPLTAVLLLGACNMNANAHDDGNHQNVRRDFQVGAFQKVSLEGSHDVVVTVGGAPSVRAEGDKALVDRLDIRVENGELKVGTKHEGGWFHFDHDRLGVVVHVTVPNLSGASIEVSGDIRIDKVEGAAFTGAIAGSGDMDIAALRVGHAGFSIAGSGGITAKGAADSSNISIAGSGDVDAQGLTVKTTSISVMGSGDVRANASESADVSVMGSGDVTMSGAGHCTIHKMGSGDVQCGS